jgi:hypothetical protein
MDRFPAQRSHRLAVAPTTRLGKWAVGLVAAIVVLAVAVVTVVPEDSPAAWVFTFSGGALVVAAGFVLFAAIYRRSERALSVYAATLVLGGGVLFLLLHSLFISD